MALVLGVGTTQASANLPNCSNCIEAGDIATGGVKSAEIATGAVGSSEIATDAVRSGEIDAGAVGSSEIANGSIGSSDLAFDLATQAELDSGSYCRRAAATTGAYPSASYPASAMCASFTTTIDAPGLLGVRSALAIGVDGKPIIAAYRESADGDLTVVHCGTLTCTSGNTVTAVDVGNDIGYQPSIAIGEDGRPVIGYFDLGNGNLKVAHCSTITCSSSTTATLDATGEAGRYSDIAIGNDGFPLVSYYDTMNGNLMVADCADAACSSSILRTLDTSGDVGLYTSIAITSGGLPVISYVDETNGALKVFVCGTGSCSTGTSKFIDLTPTVVGLTSLMIGTDGRAVIAYEANGDIRVAHCAVADCSTSSHTTIASAGTTTGPSLAIAANGLPVVGYKVAGTGLIIQRCGNVACTASTSGPALDDVNISVAPSLALGADLHIVASYNDSSASDLKFARLGSV